MTGMGSGLDVFTLARRALIVAIVGIYLYVVLLLAVVTSSSGTVEGRLFSGLVFFGGVGLVAWAFIRYPFLRSLW